MRRALIFIATLALVFSVQMAVPNHANAASGWFPTSDYCGFVYQDGGSANHNGVDIWSTSSGAGLRGAKGFPIQLAADGWLDQIYYYPGTSIAYGMRFWHSSGYSTHYWHMGTRDGNGNPVSYVEIGFTVGAFYPAGTWLGYQGDLTTVGQIVTHLHVTVWNQRAADNGSLATSTDPSNFFGRNLNAQAGGKCYFGSNPTDNSIHYTGPMAQSDHPYANNFGRWYVIVGTDPNAPVLRAEFCDLLTEAGFDYVRTYDYDINLYDQFSGHYTPPNKLSSAVPGRVMFIRLDTDQSVTDYGFRVCNFHGF
jgi:hypothetical protein